MLRIIFSLILQAGLLWAGLAVSAFGQTAPPPTDYGQIIREIIDGTPQDVRPAPGRQISDIQITLTFDDSRPLSGHMVVVSAVNTDDAVVGQSSLRLDGMRSPLSVTVPLPQALINAPIVLRARLYDTADNTVAKSEDGFYTGGTTALTLIPTLALPSVQGRVAGFETAQGTVTLAAPETVFNGATLTVQLVEDALAGGNSSPVKGEIDVMITDPTRPIAFSMPYAVPDGGFAGALGLKAVVKDWAGRTTHVMPNRVGFSGPEQRYALQLDSLRQGADVAPFTTDAPITPPAVTAPPVQLPVSPLGTQRPEQTITLISSATFPALRGLPRGATLNVTLWTPERDAQGLSGGQRVINRTSVLLDGLSGDIDFAFPDASVPGGAALYYDGTITTAEGVVLFTASQQPTGAGFSILRLLPTAAY